MTTVFSLGACRIASFLLLHSKQLVSQKQIASETRLSKAFVSRIVNELYSEGAVKRPFRTRVVLEHPEKLLVDWIGNRHAGALKTFFCGDERVLRELKRRGIQHVHSFLSGAWLDAGYLKSGFATVYVPPGFDANELKGFKFEEGTLRELKKRVALVVADDEFVFYGSRKISGERVVNSFLLYVDLASFGGIALTALYAVAEKHGFPKLQVAQPVNSTESARKTSEQTHG
ncbi:MAG: hypothetical protein V1817_01840 [Candidatus Micrarchaeota archaeon]